MKLSTHMGRERTQSAVRETVQFNAPGLYKPPYGKTVFQLEGRGRPGNPASGGNYAGTNPPTGGNYAGTNPTYPGNYAGTNPTVPGNYAGVNPSQPGNYAGTNPSTPGNPTGQVNIATYYGAQTTYSTGNSCPTPYYIPFDGTSVNFSCSPILNPPAPGNPKYNPPTPGNPKYNPPTGGNPKYNPPTGGNPYYNPYYPGNAYYNPYNPGNPGPTTNVLGVTLPGGPRGQSAPVIGPVPIELEYTNDGVSVPVPSGGYVKIINL